MNGSKLLLLVATVAFAVAFILVAFTDGNSKVALDLVYGGLTAFAASGLV